MTATTATTKLPATYGPARADIQRGTSIPTASDTIVVGGGNAEERAAIMDRLVSALLAADAGEVVALKVCAYLTGPADHVSAARREAAIVAAVKAVSP